jgi:hypothetical protein
MKMQANMKKVAMGLLIAGAAIYIYNKVPAVKRALGGA